MNESAGNIKKRPFRTGDSLKAEEITRKMISPFLRSRGFEIISDIPERNGQTIISRTPEGHHLTMRVHLCWYYPGATYSAAQLMARIKNNNWEGSLHDKIDKDVSRGVTHWLFVQREDNSITQAALVPLSGILSIWCAERDIAEQLLQQDRLGRKRKNPMKNGSSPTLYIQFDQAPEIIVPLWNYPGVQDLTKLKTETIIKLPDEDATREDSYSPQEGDDRQIIERQIRERRGQQYFRDALRKLYGNQCLVTGCDVLAVLEAAHIQPYRGANDNHPENGLLLRSDIHTLFDLDLLGIEPTNLRVELHPDIEKDDEYGSLAGKAIKCEGNQRPSQEALRVRYEQFRKKDKMKKGQKGNIYYED